MLNELEHYRGNGNEFTVPKRLGGINLNKGVLVGQDRTPIIYRPEEYQAKIVQAITENAEANPNWEYGEYYRKAMTAAGYIIPRLFNGIIVPGRDPMPFPVIGFDHLRNYHVIAQYRLVPNRFGMNFEVTFNTQQMRDVERNGKKVKEWRFTDWHFYESEVHEFAHCWQQTVLKIPKEKIDHGAVWRDKMAEFGIKTNSDGEHEFPLAPEGTPFAILMRELMVPRPDVEKLKAELGAGDMDFLTLLKLLEALFGKQGERRKGKSTLILYECPSCGLKLRVGRAKEELEIGCIKCSREKNVSTQDIVLFERHD